MLRLLPSIVIIILGLQFTCCKSNHSTLAVGKVPNYNKTSKDHIFFLDFRITGKKPGDKEKVELVKAISGNGRMKNIVRPVHYRYQIKVIPRYATSALEQELVFEHPLFKSGEVSEPGGSITKFSVMNTEGILSIRLQESSGLDRLELYSITPEKGTVKIYTLHFKP